MFWVILILALILSVVLIAMVLLQPSQGGGITAAFGGIGGTLGSTFGQRRTLEALGKWTTYFAVGIAALCLVANLFFLPTGGSVDNGLVTPGSGGVNVQANPQAPGSNLNIDPESESAPTGEAEGNAAPSSETAPSAEGSGEAQPQGE